MRKLLFATAIATLAASPAFAQQGLAPAPVNPYAGPSTNAYGAQWEQRSWSRSNVRYGAKVQGGLMTAPDYPYAGPQYGAVSVPYASAGVQAGPYAAQPMFAPSGPVAVSIDGKYLGADPDPFIRQSLIRDQDQILGTGPN